MHPLICVMSPPLTLMSGTGSNNTITATIIPLLLAIAGIVIAIVVGILFWKRYGAVSLSRAAYTFYI